MSDLKIWEEASRNESLPQISNLEFFFKTREIIAISVLKDLRSLLVHFLLDLGLLCQTNVSAVNHLIIDYLGVRVLLRLQPHKPFNHNILTLNVLIKILLVNSPVYINESMFWKIV